MFYNFTNLLKLFLVVLVLVLFANITYDKSYASAPGNSALDCLKKETDNLLTTQNDASTTSEVFDYRLGRRDFDYKFYDYDCTGSKLRELKQVTLNQCLTECTKNNSCSGVSYACSQGKNNESIKNSVPFTRADKLVHNRCNALLNTCVMKKLSISLCLNDNNIRSTTNDTIYVGKVLPIDSTFQPNNVQLSDCVSQYTEQRKVIADMTLEKCAAECKQDGDCGGFSYSAQELRCVLKNKYSVKCEAVNSAYTYYDQNIPNFVRKEFDCPGSELKRADGSSEAQCAQLCQGEKDCYGYSYHFGDCRGHCEYPKWCRLKTKGAIESCDAKNTGDKYNFTIKLQPKVTCKRGKGADFWKVSAPGYSNIFEDLIPEVCRNAEAVKAWGTAKCHRGLGDDWVSVYTSGHVKLNSPQDFDRECQSNRRDLD